MTADEVHSPRELFQEAYAAGGGGWVIGAPQPAIVELDWAGWLQGRILDVGCGTGEHTVYLTERGYDVLGVDFSTRAVELARTTAARHGVVARFEVADALRLGFGHRQREAYHTIVDSALFHVFDDVARPRYVRSLHRAAHPGGLLHVLALADTGPGIGPSVNADTITRAFAEGWAIEDLSKSRYRVAVRNREHAELLARPIGAHVDLPALLARLRRKP